MSRVFLSLLLVIILQTRESTSQDYNEDTGEKMSNKGTSISDLIMRSRCQPRESIISVYDEFPDERQYTIVPKCVPMQRCSGCCTDEGTKCRPQKTERVELEVLRFQSNEKVKLKFENHTQCSCRSQRNN